MHQPRRFLLAMIAAAGLALGGCGTSRQRLPLADVAAPIPADRARVVVVRVANLWLAQGGCFDVYQDGELVGKVAPGGFLAWDRPPGRFTLLGEGGEPMPVRAEAGRPLCVEMRVGWSIGTGVELTVVDPGNYDHLTAGAYTAPLPGE